MSGMKLELPKELEAHLNQLTANKVNQEKELAYMSFYDELTDLPNRYYFNSIVQRALAEANKINETLAVYCIDLNYFREVNDAMGYLFSNKFLMACAVKLKSYLQTDTFIARMGGDKFLVLKRYIPDENALISFESN